MTAALALILVSVIDLPSLVTVIGALKIKRWWQLPLVIILAVLIKEILGAIFATFYEPFRHLPFTLIAQTIVAVLVFRTAQSIRKRHADDPKKKRKALTQYVAVLVLVFGSLFYGVAYMSIKHRETMVHQGEARAKQAREDNASAVIAPMHASNLTPSDTFNKLFRYPAASDIPKLGDQREDGSIVLYREPVEAWWNNWTGKELSKGKVYVSGEGKTAMFEGIIQLNCQNTSGYTWLAAANYNNRTMTEEELRRIVPARVISATFATFCPVP